MEPSPGEASPGELLLRPRARDQVLLLLVCAGFVALTFLPNIRQDEATMKWGARCFFGLGASIFVLQLVPGISHLRLTPEGFEIRNLGRGDFIRWGDVDAFFPTRTGWSRAAGFRFVPEYEGARAGRAFASWLSGGAEGVLPDTYGRKAEDLVALMEEWRRRHTARG